MKFYFKVLLVLVLAGLSLKTNAQQGESTAVPFLLLAPDSRSGAIGESGGGLADNSSAIFWNPAGLAFQKGYEVSITHSNWLPQFKLDLFYDYLTYRQELPELNGVVSSSITYMNFGEFQRTGEDDPTVIGTFRSFDAALTLGYATKLHPDWGLGFNTRIIHSRLSDKGAGQEEGEGVATSISFDIAAMWRPSEFIIPLIDENIGNKFSLGMNLSNLGPKIYYIDQDQADPIPTNFRLGFAYQVLSDDFNSLLFTLDFSKLLIDRDSTGASKEFYEAIFTGWANQPFKEEMRDIVTSMGVEYWYGTPGEFLFALRSGFFYEDPSYGNRKFITFGAGIRYDMYGFDFSYITTDVFKSHENHPLSNTLRFTVLINWGGAMQTIGIPRGI